MSRASINFFMWLYENNNLDADRRNEALTAASILSGNYEGPTSGFPLSYEDILKFTDSSNDAAAIESFFRAAEFIEEGNILRILDDNFDDLDELKISPVLMAISLVQANYSGYVSDKTGVLPHAQTFGAVENIARGYKDPYKGWYNFEKLEYDDGGTSFALTSNYQNLVSREYRVTGFAVNGKTMSQTFASGEDSFGSIESAYTVAEFTDLLKAYETYCMARGIITCFTCRSLQKEMNVA